MSSYHTLDYACQRYARERWYAISICNDLQPSMCFLQVIYRGKFYATFEIYSYVYSTWHVSIGKRRWQTSIRHRIDVDSKSNRCRAIYSTSTRCLLYVYSMSTRSLLHVYSIQTPSSLSALQFDIVKCQAGIYMHFLVSDCHEIYQGTVPKCFANLQRSKNVNNHQITIFIPNVSTNRKSYTCGRLRMLQINL